MCPNRQRVQSSCRGSAGRFCASYLTIGALVAVYWRLDPRLDDLVCFDGVDLFVSVRCRRVLPLVYFIFVPQLSWIAGIPSEVTGVAIQHLASTSRAAFSRFHWPSKFSVMLGRAFGLSTSKHELIAWPTQQCTQG